MHCRKPNHQIFFNLAAPPGQPVLLLQKGLIRTLPVICYRYPYTNFLAETFPTVNGKSKRKVTAFSTLTLAEIKIHLIQ